ncbi:hypothetical protein [Streptosporangium sp. OZ121]|uniref:hypothetical protein n=1 Tax=Streptosporangium sp. OZ121 TaxID=3444183 RepID=UPI003F7A744E
MELEPGNVKLRIRTAPPRVGRLPGPCRLPAPWCYLAAAGATIAALAVIAVLDAAHKRVPAREERPGGG